MKIEHLRSLQTKNPLEKLPTPNDPIDSEMSETYGRTAECGHTYKIGKVAHECIPACSDSVWF